MKGIFLNSAPGFTILFIGIICCNLSCKKDDAPTTPPSITIQLPVENTVHNVFDAVPVQFLVQDNDRLTSVVVSLMDLNSQPVLAGVDVTPSSNPATVTMSYYLNDIHIASGYYFIKVSASDGTTTNIAIRRIYVNEAPRMLRNAYYVTLPTPSTRNIFKIDSLQNPVLAGTYAGDHSQSCISSWYQDLHTIGYMNGDLYAINLEDNVTNWSVNCLTSADPYFTDVHVNGKNSYLSFYDGRLKGYLVDGTIIMSASVQAGYYPRRIFKHDIYLAASIKEIISPARKLVLFNAATGAGYQETALSQDVVEMYTKDNDNMFCFGNDAGQGKFEIYQLSSNAFWTPYTCPAGSILSVAQVDANTYLIGHSNGTVYKYQYNINSLTTLIPGVTASCLRFDDVNLHVYVAEGVTVKRYLYSTGTLINTVNASGTVADLELLFNK